MRSASLTRGARRFQPDAPPRQVSGEASLKAAARDKRSGREIVGVKGASAGASESAMKRSAARPCSRTASMNFRRLGSGALERAMKRLHRRKWGRLDPVARRKRRRRRRSAAGLRRHAATAQDRRDLVPQVLVTSRRDGLTASRAARTRFEDRRGAIRGPATAPGSTPNRARRGVRPFGRARRLMRDNRAGARVHSPSLVGWRPIFVFTFLHP